MDRWRKNGEKPLPPLEFCYRCDLPGSSSTFDGHLPRLNYRLQHIDRNFEVIFDRCTAASGSAPGHHLYRVVRRGGGPSMDYLRLERSLQTDMAKPWPSGTPREPGDWLLDWVRKHDKAQLPVAEEKVEEYLADERDKAAESAEKKKDEEAAAPMRHFKEEAAKIISSGRNPGPNPNRRRNPKGSAGYSFSPR